MLANLFQFSIAYLNDIYMMTSLVHRIFNSMTSSSGLSAFFIVPGYFSRHFLTGQVLNKSTQRVK